MKALFAHASLFLAAVVASVVGFAGCFSAPGLDGTYRCGPDNSCPVAGYLCFDGVCCKPDGEPRCPNYALEGGLCEDGGRASTYYEDLDGDGYGSPVQQRLYCGQPVVDAFVPEGGDCDDRPEIGLLSGPGLPEACDGRDNNCDGTPDEGLPQKTVYKDQDADGFGDPAAPLSVCAIPEGFVENNMDCQPMDANAHPGGTEVCNGVDDDCDGAKDDGISGFGEACTVPSAFGVCRTGVTACVDGVSICRSTVTPALLDVCDGLDNDCDNQTDEKPDCSGPADLFSAATTRGAKKLDAAYEGKPSTCLKGSPGAAEMFVDGVWTGVGSTSHIAWAEAPVNKSWDLRNAADLRLSFTYSMTSADPTRAWAQHFQPVVLVCGPGGFIRMVHTGGAILDVATSGSVSLRVPMGRKAYGWELGTNSTADLTAVLGQAQRVEVLVQPYGVTSSFKLTFTDWGFY